MQENTDLAQAKQALTDVAKELHRMREYAEKLEQAMRNLIKRV